jgi:hypothetical protein
MMINLASNRGSNRGDTTDYQHEPNLASKKHMKRLRSSGNLSITLAQDIGFGNSMDLILILPLYMLTQAKNGLFSEPYGECDEF